MTIGGQPSKLGGSPRQPRTMRSYREAERVVAARLPGASELAHYRIVCAVGNGHGRFSIAPTDTPSYRDRVGDRFFHALRRACELDDWVAGQLRKGREVSIPLPGLVRNVSAHVRSRPKVGDSLLPLVTRQTVQLPLYPYQRKGVSRLLRARRLLLADDMGLGKTLQVVATLKKLLESGRADRVLVVAPTSLLTNWAVECLKWAPEISVRVGGGATARATIRECWNYAHVLVTNYEQLRSVPRPLTTKMPHIVVLDEAHRVRSWENQAVRGIRSLKPEYMWALTGTPLEKGRIDLVGLMSLLVPGAFRRRDERLPPWLLRAKIRPHTLRREKQHVLAELPPITYRLEHVNLSEGQRRRYDRVRRLAHAAENPVVLFGQLRTLCDYDPQSGESGKLDRVVELLEDIVRAGERAIVFSYLLEPLRLLKERLEGRSLPFCGIYEGQLTSAARERMIEAFRALHGGGALLASLRAAGEGLTLTEAQHVVLVNRWWNPSSNAQAVDRVHRIGQQRPVTVYYLQTTETIEERLSELLADKERVFDETVAALAESGELFAET